MPTRRIWMGGEKRRFSFEDEMELLEYHSDPTTLAGAPLLSVRRMAAMATRQPDGPPPPPVCQ